MGSTNGRRPKLPTSNDVACPCTQMRIIRWRARLAPAKPRVAPAKPRAYLRAGSRLLFGNARGRIRAAPNDQIDGLYSGSRIDLSDGGIPAGLEALTGNRMAPAFRLPGGFPGQPETDHFDVLQLAWTHFLAAASGLGAIQVRYGYSTAHLDTRTVLNGQSIVDLLDGTIAGAEDEINRVFLLGAEPVGRHKLLSAERSQLAQIAAHRGDHLAFAIQAGARGDLGAGAQDITRGLLQVKRALQLGEIDPAATMAKGLGEDPIVVGHRDALEDMVFGIVERGGRIEKACLWITGGRLGADGI